MNKNIYVAATNQHIGKTTSTLGLVMALQDRGYKVGYCKPVGQEFVDLGDLKVDKDALLFSKTMGFGLEEALHSPVILGRGATTSFLDNPSDYNYEKRILDASKRLDKANDLVIYEGTGHPGVGSVVGMSNATVAKMLNASVVMIVEGGIGNTIDRLHMSACIFHSQQVPIVGVIINKVLPNKIEKVRRYVGGWLKTQGIKLLGVLPYDKSLSMPIMHTIVRAISGETILNNDYLTNRVEGLIPGSLVSSHDFRQEKNLLLVVSNKRLLQALESIEKNCKKLGVERSPLSGIILTGEDPFLTRRSVDLAYLSHFTLSNIPIISTSLDTYGAVVKINSLEVKINIHTPWKVERAIRLVKENVDLEPLLP